MENTHEWLVYNSMETNPDKFQFIIVEKLDSRTLQVNDITIKSSSCVTLLCITIDSELNFKEHIESIIHKIWMFCL